MKPLPDDTENSGQPNAPASEQAEAAAANPADESMLAKVRAERDRAQDQLTRTLADFQNVRKRHLKEMEEARHRAIAGLTVELLPVIDNFQRALMAHEQNDQDVAKSDARSLLEGVRMVRNLLQGTLERHGLAELPVLGKTFDPNQHEAVGVDPVSQHAPGTVTAIVQAGYMLNDRLIRPAKVMVAGGEQRATQPSNRESTDQA